MLDMLFGSSDLLEEFPWHMAVTVMLTISIAAGLAYVHFNTKAKQATSNHVGEVIHAVCGAEGTLWRNLHPQARETCEKPFVMALERAIQKQLGKPRAIHTSSLETRDAPAGFSACTVEVTFEHGLALVMLCWETGSKRIGAIEISPEDGPLAVQDNINSSVFEQKTDAFIGHLLSGRVKAAFALMHKNLQDKLSEDALIQQKTSVLAHMGQAATAHYDPDTTFHAAVSEKIGGLKVTKITATLCGESQDADGVFYWVLNGMECKLVKFEIKTTGKAKRETVFVHPDGSRIDSVA